MDRGGQCLSLMSMRHIVQPVPEDGSEKREDSMCREQGVGIGGAEPMMGKFDHGDI